MGIIGTNHQQLVWIKTNFFHNICWVFQEHQLFWCEQKGRRALTHTYIAFKRGRFHDLWPLVSLVGLSVEVVDKAESLFKESLLKQLEQAPHGAHAWELKSFEPHIPKMLVLLLKVFQSYEPVKKAVKIDKTSWPLLTSKD